MGSRNRLKEKLCPPRVLDEHTIYQSIFEPLKLVFDEMPDMEKDVILMILEEEYESVTNLSDIEKTAHMNIYPRAPTPNHFLTFCLKNVRDSWYQPIGTIFWRRGYQVPLEKKSGCITRQELAECIVTVIKAVQGINVNVICTICPPSKRLCKIINYLVTSEEYRIEHRNEDELIYKVNNQEIVHLYDSAELLRELRNTFSFKKVCYEENNKKRIASVDHLNSWLSNTEKRKHIIEVETHLKPDDDHKHHMIYVMGLFSERVAAAMEKHIASDLLNKNEFSGTTNYIRLFSQLFDSLNSNFRHVNKTKLYKGPVTYNSAHFALWERAIPILKSMYFSGPWHDTSCLDSLHSQIFRKWISTIKGTMRLFELLSSKGWDSIATRSFNCEALVLFIKKLAMQNGVNAPLRTYDNQRLAVLRKDIENMSLEPMIGTAILVKPNSWCFTINCDDY